MMETGKMVLLLTACVKPEGMSFTRIQDSGQRLKEYEDALDWYLKHTPFRIVVVENTLTDFSDRFAPYKESERLEFITFSGNNFDKGLGKGYGEGLIMRYAFEHSSILKDADRVAKITGRIIIENIMELIHRYFSFSHPIVMANTAISGDRFFAYSLFFIAPKDFFINYFLPGIGKINDEEGYYFEHLLYNAMRSNGLRFCREFDRPIKAIGVSGSTGEVYYTPQRFQTIKCALKAFLKRHGIYGFKKYV